jgi:hypothetical protein
MVWLEALTGVYAALLLVVALSKGIWGLVFWLTFISGGYIYTTIVSFKQFLEEKRAERISPVDEPVRVSTQMTTSNPGQD